MRKNGIILLNGKTQNRLRIHKRDAIIICVDGGIRHILNTGIPPNIILGDFDSLPSGMRKTYTGTTIEWMSHPPEKDQYETDSELALRIAQERGITHCDIYGFSGDRIDHMIANLLLFVRFSSSMHIQIHLETSRLTYVTTQYRWKGSIGDVISLIPLTPIVKDINTHGLTYPLAHTSLKIGSSLGVSNTMNQPNGEIHISSGCLLHIHTQTKS